MFLDIISIKTKNISWIIIRGNAGHILLEKDSNQTTQETKSKLSFKSCNLILRNFDYTSLDSASVFRQDSCTCMTIKKKYILLENKICVLKNVLSIIYLVHILLLYVIPLH